MYGERRGEESYNSSNFLVELARASRKVDRRVLVGGGVRERIRPEARLEIVRRRRQVRVQRRRPHSPLGRKLRETDTPVLISCGRCPPPKPADPWINIVYMCTSLFRHVL